jgi:iron complex transport system ATP-binding protein
MIAVENLSLSFDDVQVLDGLDLGVERGEFVAVVGPNGAGKSTLLRTINGTLDPDDGTVTLDGTPTEEQSARAVSRQVGTVPQDTSMGFAFTVEQVVEMGRTPHRSRLDWTDEGDPIDRALERTETAALRDRQIDEISGGQRQRVVLARALAQEPDALVLDEPTASLDINHQIRVLELITELVADGKAVLAAIHDLDLAARYCDRIAVLADGQIRANGRPETVLDDPALERAFGTETAVTANPVTGTPTVTALGDRPNRDGRVHVTGVGESAVAATRRLWQAGFTVSVGPVPEGSVLAHAAAAFGIDVLTAPPFQPPGEAVASGAEKLVAESDVLVVVEGGSAEGDIEASEPTEPPRIRFDPSAAQSSERPAVAGDGGQMGTVRSLPELVPAVGECLDAGR